MTPRIEIGRLAVFPISLFLRHGNSFPEEIPFSEALCEFLAIKKIYILMVFLFDFAKCKGRGKNHAE